jgi:lipopolysaccharide/colanic/teichoic acid biosynthesis glycosyltransferase
LVDAVLGTVLVLVALPVILLLSVAVSFSFRTWRPFFLQKRVGRRGKPFTIIKLRTLPVNAPPTADKYTIATVETTRLGRLLRATHLDELPQLFLVPLGRMSLVGPRPEMPGLLASFDQSFVVARSRVRPGCTGLWQISVDAGRLIGEAPEYDLYYLQHAGVRLDAWVLWRSLVFVMSGRAVSFAEIPVWARRRHEVSLELAGIGALADVDLAPELAPETMPASG